MIITRRTSGCQASGGWTSAWSWGWTILGLGMGLELSMPTPVCPVNAHGADRALSRAAVDDYQKFPLIGPPKKNRNYICVLFLF